MKKFKHKIKLLWLRRKWIIQSVYNTPGFKEAGGFLEFEKEIIELYHKAQRENDKEEIIRGEGRLEVIEFFKEMTS